MKKERLKHGEFIAMSAEEKLNHKRFLQKRWRKSHPEWVKNSNKYWAARYKETKPFVCVCAYCGKTFNGRRSCLKMCQDCIQKLHDHAEALRVKKKMRILEKRNLEKQIISWHNQGLNQVQISKILGRSQSGISVILRKHNIRKLKPRNRLTTATKDL